MSASKSDQKLMGDLVAEVRFLKAEVVQLRLENAQLREENAQLRAENMQLRAENVALKERIEDLEEKLNTNSRNSSTSPSQDPYRKRKSRTRASGRDQGPQKGHEGHTRALFLREEVSEFRDIFPNECPHCGGKEFSQNFTCIYSGRANLDTKYVKLLPL